MRLCVGVTGVKAVDVLGTEFEGRDPVWLWVNKSQPQG